MGLRVHWRCEVPGCGANGWADGWSEADTNSAGVKETDPMEDACEHIIAGGGYEIIDEEYGDPYEL